MIVLKQAKQVHHLFHVRLLQQTAGGRAFPFGVRDSASDVHWALHGVCTDLGSSVCHQQAGPPPGLAAGKLLSMFCWFRQLQVSFKLIVSFLLAAGRLLSSLTPARQLSKKGGFMTPMIAAGMPVLCILAGQRCMTGS